MTRTATLTFARSVSAPVDALWHAWTDPAARALWAAPTPAVTVEFLDPGPDGREISLCQEEGQPEIRCETGWLHLSPPRRSVNWEVVSTAGTALSAALVTADLTPQGDRSHLAVTVQLSSLGQDMEQGCRQGFNAGLGNLSAVAARTLVITRTIRAPRSVVWGAWVNPETLPQWWGPEGFTCRTARIDLRPGGEWVFDMIGPDGTIYPNHHLYHRIQPQHRLCYTLLWGENGPKHADAWAAFADTPEGTRVTLGMVFVTEAECQTARGFGAEELGQQTLGKLARFIGAS